MKRRLTLTALLLLIAMLAWRMCLPPETTPPHSAGVSSGSPTHMTGSSPTPSTDAPQRSAHATPGPTAAAGLPPAQRGTAPTDTVTAKITVNGRARNYAANDLGYFPRVYVAARATVPIEMTFPDAVPGERVFVEVQDGGAVDDKGITRLATLGDDRRFAFNFTLNDEEGVYRVALRRNSVEQVLEFWVGPEFPLATIPVLSKPTE